MPRTMAYARCGDAFHVVAHTRDAPTDAEWQLYLHDMELWLPHAIGVLVFTDGGGPNGGQRRAMRDMFARLGPLHARTAVVASSLLVRGIVNAINLFNPHIRSFRPDALDAAIHHMGGTLHRDALMATLTEQRQRLVA